MNTNIRIKNRLGIWATVWPISEHFYSVKWDDNPITVTVTEQQLEVLKQYAVEVNISTRSAVKTNKYGEKSVESDLKELPKVFKFVHINDNDKEIVYTFTADEKGNTDIRWESDPRPGRTNEWSVEEARDLISRGVWVVIPDEPKKNIIDTIQIKIALEGLEEAEKAVGELAEASNTLLESIKDFTSGTGHDVWIANGVYKVFRQYEDIPYIARDEETLMEIMEAIMVLDSVETE